MNRQLSFVMKVVFRKILSIVLLATMVLAACTDENTFPGSSQSIPALESRYLHLGTTSINMDASASSKQLQVGAVTTAWQFRDYDTSWLGLDPASGNSDATVSIAATENRSAADVRTSIFTFESTQSDFSYQKQVSVTQQKATPYITATPSTLNFTAAGGTQSATVSANADWTATGIPSWITMESSGTATASKQLNMSAAENLSKEERSATITLSTTSSPSTTATVKIVQAPAADPSVVPEVTETLTFPNTGGKYELRLTSEVSWTATCQQSWLEAKPTEGQAGTTTLTIEATPNGSTDDREGNVYISIGSTRRITIPICQQGIQIDVTPKELTFSADAQTQQLNVESNTTWEVISKPEWLTVKPQQGNDSQTVTLSTEDNWDTSLRTGILKIGKKGIDILAQATIAQQGRTFDDIVAQLSFDSEEGKQDVEVKTNGRWTATTDAQWITLSPDYGQGNCTMTVSVNENTREDVRQSAIIVSVGEKTQTTVVTQKGKYFSVTPTVAINHPSKGGTHQVTVKGNDPWTATSTSTWMQLSQRSGNGDINVILTTPDNPSIQSRQDETTFTPSHLTPVTIRTKQEGRYLTIDHTELSFFHSAGTSEPVTISTDATYTVGSSDPTWLTVKQTGNTFTATVTENTTRKDREATILIAMTGLQSGESYQVKLPVKQYYDTHNINLVTFGTDEQWDIIHSATAVITITGFGRDEQWDADMTINAVITINGFGNDDKWD